MLYQINLFCENYDFCWDELNQSPTSLPHKFFWNEHLQLILLYATKQTVAHDLKEKSTKPSRSAENTFASIDNLF